MNYKIFSLAFLFSVLFSSIFADFHNQKQQKAVQHPGKRGLSWASSVSKDIALFNTSSLISWNYNWSPNKVDPMDVSGLEFTPMIWNGVGIDKLAAKVFRSQAKHVLAFNEPDLASEANMDPATAARLWIQYLEPLRASGIKLGSPAVTQGATGWLREFFKACNGSCTVDFICTHWYGEGIGNYYDWLWSFYYQFNIPLWITEYGCTSSSPADVAAFMKATTSYMDSLPWVQKYAWFGAFRDSQLPMGPIMGMVNGATGQLNQLGKIYTGVSLP